MQRTVVRSVLGTLALGFLGAALAQGAQLGVRDDSKLGAFLTGEGGKTLYIFTKDAPGVSNCYDRCATAWPPLLATELPTLPRGAPGKLTLIPREDGQRQVAYNGQPLYYWQGDAKAGDASGQNVGKVWFAANLVPTVGVGKSDDLGSFLVGPSGMTLYLYTKDAPDKSNCYGGCAVAWPPLLVSQLPVAGTNVTGKLGTTARTDGSLQVTYDGKPLYYWFKDKKVGDTTGQNVGKVWFVLKP